MIGHAVFDLDGTLVDSAPAIADILNAMLEDRGEARRLELDQVRPHVTAGGPAMVTALLGARCGDPAAALAEFRARYAAAPTPPGSLYPGAREALAALARAGVGLALFSNKPRALCEKILRDLDLFPMFSAVIGAGPGVPLKPDPTGLDLALDAGGGARDRACFVGDSEADYALAMRAGVPVVMVAWGYGEAGRAWPGAAVAARMSRVPELVLAALAPAVAV
jgi:phosphoglycolate phosphatase